MNSNYYVLVVLATCCLDLMTSNDNKLHILQLHPQPKYELKSRNVIQNNNFNCNEVYWSCSPSKLVVKGFDVKISDVLQITCPRNSKFIEIFALNKIIIDADIDKTGEKVHLSIIAPTWDIIGNRKIDLNGAKGKSYLTIDELNNIGDGRKGKSGRPGGAAGRFLGVGNVFQDSHRLIIAANGGNGGRGQNGGNGTDGMKGEDPPISKKSKESLLLWKEQKFDYWMINDNETILDSILDIKEHVHSYVVFGKKALLPGNGGDGGAGGIGGNSGDILIFGLSETPQFLSYSFTGEMGEIGFGGFGGKGTSNGEEVMVQYIDVVGPEDEIQYGDPLVIRKVLNFTSGSNGADGINEDKIKSPHKETFLYPSHVINEYKYYARECLAQITSDSFIEDTNVEEPHLKLFLDNLDTNEIIDSLYDTEGLVDELFNLERQYLSLRNKLSFSSFFESTLYRISRKSKDIAESIENKKVLKFLYTTIMIKLANPHHKNVPIINLIEYMENMQKHAEKLREVNRNLIITDFKGEYSNSLTGHINSAYEFIETDIIPEIERLFNETDKKIFESLTGVYNLFNSTAGFNMCDWFDNMTFPDSDPDSDPNANPESNNGWNCTSTTIKFSSYKAALENSLILRQFLIALNIVPSLLKSVASVGAAVGKAVEGTTMNDEWVQTNMSNDKGNEEFLALAATLNSSLNVTGQQLKKKHELFLKDITDIKDELETKLKSLSLNSATISNVNMVLLKINKLKEAVTYQMINDVVVDPTEIDRMRNELATFLQDKNVVLQLPQKPLSFMTKHEITSDVMMETYQHAWQNDMKKNNLQEMEQHFYSSIVSQLRHFEESLDEITRKLDDKSHIELDISEWRIQSTLRDLKVLFRQASREIPEQDDIERTFQKLDETINILINLYDRIDSYAEQQQLITYFGSIVSGQPQYTNNIHLNEGVQKYQQFSQINLILDKYEIMINAFKQHMFPFASMYMDAFDLPTNLKFNDVDSMMQEVIQQIDYLKEKFESSDISAYDFEIIDFDFSGTSYAYYYWTNKTMIETLLRGDEIKIFANISHSEWNAVKYNRIGIEIRMTNEKQQKQLDAALESFGVSMTMVSDAYSRCGDKIYCLPMNEIVIDYSFIKRTNGKPYFTNKLYKKLSENDPFLSPFGMWRIQLKRLVDTGFDDLQPFLKDVYRMDLTGSGQYINDGPLIDNVCTDKLDDIYSLCDIYADDNI